MPAQAGGEAKDEGVIGFLLGPIVHVLDDPIGLATTAAEERARRRKTANKKNTDDHRRCASCRCLDLTNGRLAREPFEPEYLTSLTCLRLSNNGIKGIQASTFNALTQLTWLELNNNKLSRLPGVRAM
jgi:Leucine-rich repeat (LRR) protein